eukprot:g1389.t1
MTVLVTVLVRLLLALVPAVALLALLARVGAAGGGDGGPGVPNAEGKILSFKCGGGGMAADGRPAVRIEQAWVNDDYCDCPDGSDETETSACAHLWPLDGEVTRSTFRCINTGHISADIPVARVADGICDCCDGTDERHFLGPGGNPCADTCVEVGRSYRKQRARDQLLLRQGLRVKADASKRVAKLKYQRAAELAQLKEDLSDIELVRQIIEGRKFTEEAIEFKEQAWRAKHMEALDDDSESKMEADEIAAGSTGGGTADKLIKRSMEDAKRERDAAKNENAASRAHAQKTHVWLGPEPDEETKSAHRRALAEADDEKTTAKHQQNEKQSDNEATAANSTRIPRGELGYRAQQVRNMTISFAPSRLLHGVPNSDIDPAMKAAREAATTKLFVNHAGAAGTAASIKASDGGTLDETVRTCGLLEFLASPASDSVTSMEILAAKTRGGADQGIWGFWGISLMDISVGIGGIPPELREGGEDQLARKRRQRKRTRKEMRRYGFMGPIFNGGREGWARGYRYILSGLGLIFSPVRLLWELTSFLLWSLTSVVRILTPEFLASPLRKQYARLTKILWMRVGVKVRRLWRRYEGPWAWRAFWNAVPEVYRFYFPHVDAKHVRPEAEALRIAIKLVDNEKATLERRIRELESKKTVNYGPGGLFTELAETCVSASFQGYNYEVCPFKEAKQNGATSLGKWNGFGDYRNDDKTPAPGSVPQEAGGNEKQSLKPYFDWWFTGGTSCYQGPKRKSLVHLKCGPDNILDNVVEPETCMYEMTMRTPAACDENDLDPIYDDVEKPCWDIDKLGCY